MLTPTTTKDIQREHKRCTCQRRTSTHLYDGWECSNDPAIDKEKVFKMPSHRRMRLVRRTHRFDTYVIQGVVGGDTLLSGTDGRKHPRLAIAVTVSTDTQGDLW